VAKIRWTVGARRDLHEIINYIADDSPAYAINFAERIILAVDRLETFPKL
jgi:plasmid stabilization system protein ParE